MADFGDLIMNAGEKAELEREIGRLAREKAELVALLRECRPLVGHWKWLSARIDAALGGCDEA